MSKKYVRENYHVVIEPRGLGDLEHISVSDRLMCKDEADRQRQYRERCEEIAAEVKRHVSNVGNVKVVCDTIPECEHCHARWTEDDPDYNGGCCAADQDAQDAREQAARRLGVAYGHQEIHETAQAPASEAVHETRQSSEAEARIAGRPNGECPPQATAINAP